MSPPPPIFNLWLCHIHIKSSNAKNLNIFLLKLPTLLALLSAHFLLSGAVFPTRFCVCLGNIAKAARQDAAFLSALQLSYNLAKCSYTNFRRSYSHYQSELAKYFRRIKSKWLGKKLAGFIIFIQYFVWSVFVLLNVWIAGKPLRKLPQESSGADNLSH